MPPRNMNNSSNSGRRTIHADHKKMVKARLETFLKLTADVDFNAALKEEYRLKKFVNSGLRKKTC